MNHLYHTLVKYVVMPKDISCQLLTLHFCGSQAWNQPVKVGGSNPCFTTRIGVSRSRPAGWDFRYSCAVTTASCFSVSLAPLPIHRYTWQNIIALWFLVVWKRYEQFWRETTTLTFTWSQMSSNITSSSSRSSWLKFVISVAIKRPVWLEHSNNRGVTLLFSSWSLRIGETYRLCPKTCKLSM